MRSRNVWRAILATAALVSVAVAATACSPTEPREPTTPATPADIDAALEAGAHLTIWASGSELSAAAARFEAAHPAVEIDVLAPGDPQGPDAGLDYMLERGEHIPDVIEAYSPDDVARHVRNGALTDLTRFGADDLESAFTSAAWDSVAYAGGIWALPDVVAPAAIAYRADILEAAGIEEFPTTWDEFAAASATVKAETGMHLAGLGAPQLDWLIRQGAPPLVDWDGGDDLRVSIANPASLRTAEYWDTLLDDDLALALRSVHYARPIAMGAAAALVGTPPELLSLQYELRSAGGDLAQWRVAPLPQWDPEAPSYVGDLFGQWAIPAAAENPVAAYGFIEWLTTENASVDGAVPGALPAYVDALMDPQRPTSQPRLFGGQQADRVFADAAMEMTFSGRDPAQIWQWTFQGEAAVWIGITSLSDFLEDFEADFADLATQNGYTVVTDPPGG